MKTLLIQAPYKQNTEIKFPPTLVEIGYASLNEIPNTELKFPFSFSRINGQASITGNPNLVAIYFYGNLFQIQTDAIISCPNLANIYYYGTVSVQTKIFADSLPNLKIMVCASYEGNSFATISNIIKEGACPDMNFLRYITCKKSFLFSHIFVCCFTSIIFK